MDETPQSSFAYLWNRLQMVERWRELAIRPNDRGLWPEDQDLFDHEVDDCALLLERSLQVRRFMNDCLTHDKVLDEEFVAKPSTIPDAGLGLFYQPSSKKSIDENVTICYYSGHIHDYQSAKMLVDRSYLMCVQGDILVDPGPLHHIKARFINDPLNEDLVNCKYVPDVYRSAVVTTRKINPGEELFASYGDGYWAQHSTLGHVMYSKP